MTLMKRMAMALGLAIAVVAVGLMYLGAFSPVRVSEESAGPFTFVYRGMQGTDLRQVGVITSDLDAMLASRGLSDRQPLDAFFPDGHAEIGFAVTGVTPQSLAELSSQAMIREIPAQPVITARFPWRMRLSFLVGAMKIDPAFAAYRATRGYAKTEAYALNTGDTLVYFQPVLRASPR